MLRTFDSIEDYARTALVKVPSENQFRHREDPSWFNGTFDEAFQGALVGDDTLAARAMALIEEFAPVSVETGQFQRVRGPIGTTCDMGAWMAGSPDCMRRRVRRQNDIAPLKVVANITVGVTYGAAVAEARGAAILALVLRIQRERPVDLYLTIETYAGGDLYDIMRVETRPLAVGVAAFAMCNPVFFRRLGLGMAGPKFHGGAAYGTDRQHVLGLTEQDVYVPWLNNGDQLATNPKQWLKTQLERLGIEV